MKFAFAFLLLGLACLYYAITSKWPVVQFIAASCAIAFTGVGLAYAFIGPRAFLKRDNGQLHPLSCLVYWPYHFLNWLSLAGFRRSIQENAFDRIDENIYLGCRLSPRDLPTIQELKFAAVLDLTCEFSELKELRSLNYRCIPLLDTTSPSREELIDGAQWIKQQAQNGPVYIHCALGHGRSATFVVAYLLVSGQFSTPGQAIEFVKTLRPRIGLHPVQMAILDTFMWAK